MTLVDSLQREFPSLESDVLLEYGYESAQHLALRDSIRLRNEILRGAIDGYLDLYGFPAKRQPDQALIKKAQTELFERMKDIPKTDSVAIDSVYRTVVSRYPSLVRELDCSALVVRVLETETNFDKRCEMISILRFEYELENISLGSTLAFLRHTYVIEYGEELGIVAGTTESERLIMYARELSGCWGN